MDHTRMSYDIQLYRTETKKREQQLKDERFFENENNLEPFTKQQYEELQERLLTYDYVLESESENGLAFKHAYYPIEASLTNRGLYFTSGFNEECIFEAGMTASEFTDTGDFVKYDPQSDGWE
ncbi:MAG: hypothetical protein K0R51_3467 [Cytophagaceae bacterium]|jgi:hypothetical protein|nr:hypothetical protein [Cytophagaceae bacterium]